VLTQPFPGFLLDLEPVPLRDALLHPPDQDRGGVHAFDVDRLVGGEQRDACVGKLAFQLERVERVPAGAFDVLTDDGGEPRVRGGGFGEQVGQAAVAGDADVELLVGAAVATCLKVEAAGFDVQNQAAMNDPGGPSPAPTVAGGASRTRGLGRRVLRCGRGTPAVTVPRSLPAGPLSVQPSRVPP
jgi:hypothetical protein